MSENLKKDINNVKPTNKNMPKKDDIKLKGPQFIMHCLTVKTEKEKKIIKESNDNKNK